MVFFIDVTDKAHPFGAASYEPGERAGHFCNRGCIPVILEVTGAPRKLAHPLN